MSYPIFLFLWETFSIAPGVLINYLSPKGKGISLRNKESTLKKSIMIKQKSYWVLEAESSVLFLGCLVWRGQAFSLLWTLVPPPEKWECWTRRHLKNCPAWLPKLTSAVSLFAPLPQTIWMPPLFHCSFVLLVMAGSIISIPPEPRDLKADNWNLESRTRRLSRGDVSSHIFASSEWAIILPKRQGPRGPEKSIWTSDPKTHTSFLPRKWWTSFKTLFD